MARLSYNELSSGAVSSSTDNSDYTVKFFNIKNGEDAIVRFLVDSADDFDIRTVHRVKMEGYQYGRTVNCIMENNNPASCPLCASGNKIDQRLYIRMLKYTVENNAVVVTPVVWERSVFDKKFGTQALINYIRDYGPLSDILCRISRSGEGLNTNYTPTFGLNIMPNTRAMYRDEIYPKSVELFGDFDVLGVSIMDKNLSELTHFVQTGNFPLKSDNNASEPRVSIPNNATTFNAPTTPMPNTAEHSYGAPGTYVPSNNVPEAPTTNIAIPRPAPNWGATPTSGSEGGFNRPRRF